jgi:bifunctional non-homologous end joining protein LigD
VKTKVTRPQGSAERSRISPDGPQITHRQLCLASSRQRPFSAPGWIFEFKYDGYRCLGRGGKRAQMISRKGVDMAAAFPEVARELAKLPPGSAIDGELVVLGEDGHSRFDELSMRSGLERRESILRASRACPAAIVAWDMLAYDGRDLRKLSLVRRKLILRRALHGMKRLRVAAHVPECGEPLYAEALVRQLEGIVGKRAESAYRAGRTPDWVKIKTPIGRERERLRHARVGRR